MVAVVRSFLFQVVFIVILVGSRGSLAFEVKPLVHDLEPVGRSSTTTIVVTNPSDQPLPIEITVNQRVFDDAGIQALVSADDDFLVFPPFASVAPGATQSIRIQWLGEPELAESQSYYANVAQLPVTPPSGSPAQLQYVLAFNVAVHVSPKGSEASIVVVDTELEQGADGRTFVIAGIENTGTRYTYASRLALDLTSPGNQRTIAPGDILALELDTLLPPGVTKTLRIPVENGGWTAPVAVELRPVDRR